MTNDIFKSICKLTIHIDDIIHLKLHLIKLFNILFNE